MIHLSTIQGRTGKYEISADNTRLHCSCPSAKYRPKSECKHIRNFKSENPNWKQLLDPLSPQDYEDIEAESLCRMLKDLGRE